MFLVGAVFELPIASRLGSVSSVLCSYTKALTNLIICEVKSWNWSLKSVTLHIIETDRYLIIFKH